MGIELSQAFFQVL